jgi:hypothetical protein
MTALTNSKLNQTDTRRQIPWLKVRILKKAGRLVMLYFLAGLVALICLIPIIWMVKTSFETTKYMRSSQIQFWPIQPTLNNYLNVLNNPNAAIGRSMLNSLIVSTLATLLNLAITATAAYAMSRFKFRGKIIFAMYLLIFYMIPGTLLLIGMFVMLARLHLVNNWIGLILIYAVGGIPLSTWWLKGYFDSIPIEIEEGAMEGGLAPSGARCGCGRNFPVCGMLERIHDGPNYHPEPETPTPTRSNRQFYGSAAYRMGSSDGIQRNCGHTGSDFVCYRSTWYRQWNDVRFYPVTHFAQPNY